MREVTELGPGKCFGELALLMNKPRAATVMCLEDSQFATLDKASFHKSLGAIQRKRLNDMLKFMMELPCFHGWTHTSILKFSYYLKKIKLQRNEYLFQYGEQTSRVYILKKGEIKLYRKVPN